MKAGFYKGQLVSVTTDTTSNGTPWIVFTNKVYAEWLPIENRWYDLESPAEAKVWMCIKEGKSRDITEQKLESMGFDGNYDNPRFADVFYTGVDLRCDHETYNGKNKEVWSYNDYDGKRESKPLATDVLKLMSAQFKSKHKPKDFGAPKPLSPVGNGPNQVPVTPTDEVPF